MKCCRYCGLLKTDFQRDKSRPDGLSSRCKACTKAYRHKIYMANRQAVAQSVKNYRLKMRADPVKHKAYLFKRKLQRVYCESY